MNSTDNSVNRSWRFWSLRDGTLHPPPSSPRKSNLQIQPVCSFYQRQGGTTSQSVARRGKSVLKDERISFRRILPVIQAGNPQPVFSSLFSFLFFLFPPPYRGLKPRTFRDSMSLLFFLPPAPCTGIKHDFRLERSEVAPAVISPLAHRTCHCARNLGTRRPMVLHLVRGCTDRAFSPPRNLEIPGRNGHRGYYQRRETEDTLFSLGHISPRTRRALCRSMEIRTDRTGWKAP